MLDTEALSIRHLNLDDTAPIFRLSQEQGMRTWLPDQVYADEARAFEVLCFLTSRYGPSADPRHAPYVLGVCLSASHELIGHVGFSPCEHGVEVGYAIGAAYQERGVPLPDARRDATDAAWGRASGEALSDRSSCQRGARR